MSHYDWPRDRANRRFKPRRGRAAARRLYNAGLNAGFDAEALAEARARRHMVDPNSREARAAEGAARTAMAAGPQHTGDQEMVARAAPPAGGPNADRDLWLPLGPSGTLRGQADGDPRVAGRVRDLVISPDGQRAYAASALGGVWYTDSAGARWEPVGAWAMASNTANLAASSHTLTCGSLHVRFDAGNDPANDEVWIATGEPGRLRMAPVDTGATGQYAGVGILHATGPVQTSRTQPLNDPWTRQAQPRTAGPNLYVGLRGAAVFRLASDPANAVNVVAATTRGLHHNTSGLAPDPWALVTVAAWEGLAAGSSGTAAVTDVAWTPATGAHAARLWVAVVDTNTPALTDVWVSTNGIAGPFAAVGLPGVVGTVTRLSLATDPAFPDVIYVLGSGPQVWRIDGTAPATVAPLPAQLFGGAPPNDQSDYDMAIAIDPANVGRIVIGGAAVQSPNDNSFSACLYRLTVGGAAPAYNTDYAGGEANDARWVGAGVHADVHQIRWRRVGAADHVWVCCDGGIFRSTGAAAPGSFVSRSTGLAVTEPGFLANHPITEGIVLAGVQDNGAQLRIGESVWRRALHVGDAGGVAFDPGTTGRFVALMHNADWLDDSDAFIGPSFRGPASPAYTAENAASRFYSNAEVVRRGDGVTQLVVGTHRVWYTERWGRSRRDGTIFRRNWITIPGGADPRAGNANDAVTDVLAPGPLPPGSMDPPGTVGVRAMRWAGPDRLCVLMHGAIYRLDRNPPTNGAWASTNIVTRTAAPAVAPPPAWPVAAANLPDTGALNDLAIHNAGAGPHGSFYVATSHAQEPVWWFDGTGQFHPVRLGTDVPPPPPVPGTPTMPANGVRAPAYAVAVDPDDARIVYVGTTVGVWRGVLTLTGGNPTWVWNAYNSGLPEAAVQDLVIGTWPRPAGGMLKLLRAALQSRGVWEVAPGVDATPTTYLRVHPYDTRRITPTDQRDPMWNQPTPEREWPLDWGDRRNRDYRNNAGQPRATPDGTPVGSYHWHGSPDIRLRPAPGGPAVPLPPGLPWTTAPADRFWLWSLQTSLRTIDPLIVPDGRWTAGWRTRLRAVRVTLGIDTAASGGQARVTAALWNHAQVQAGFWTDPWADGGPTEVDLVERIYGAATPRVGGASSRATSPASLGVLRRPYRLHVCLHHRGREPLAAAAPAAVPALVILLRFPLPANAAQWAGLATIGLPGDQPTLDALRAALNAVPAGGGAIPAQLALPAGWGPADVGVAIRRPDRALATGAPAIITFDIDFSAAARGSRHMLIAIAHSAIDPLTLTGATLSTMILGNRHAAARSIQIV